MKIIRFEISTLPVPNKGRVFFCLFLKIGGFAELIQTQEIGLHTPHPFASLRAGSDPLPQGERAPRKSSPPSMGGGKGEGDYVNLLNSLAIVQPQGGINCLRK